MTYLSDNIVLLTIILHFNNFSGTFSFFLNKETHIFILCWALELYQILKGT